MSDKRKRQIIRESSPGGQGEPAVVETPTPPNDQPPEHKHDPNLLDKRVNLPAPLIFLGFLTIIFISVMVTYVVVKWPAPALKFAVNENIAELEAMVALEVVMPVSRGVNRVVAVNAPVADLQAGEARFAGVVPAITPKATLAPNPNGQSLAGALDVSNPVAIITLRTRTPGPVVDAGDAGPQKLMQQRFANAVAPPELQNGTNPLEQSVIGEVTEAGEPTLAEAVGSNDPVAVLTLPSGSVPVAAATADIPGQKLMQQRLANAVAPPEVMATPPADISPPEDGILSGPTFAGEEDKPWRRFAVATPLNTAGKGRIVIVIDDMGNNSAMANSFSQLPGPLNFAFLPYAPNLGRQTALMRASGHELLVHMPMEPSGNENPGPRALLTSLTREELLAAIEWNLTRFEGYVGVNNHMGSRFTKDPEGMAVVMAEFQKRGLLFLDSRTAPNSEGALLAKRMGMPWAGRDIFLDNEINDAAILRQLLQVERLAKSRGQVIAIGHPYGATLRVLRDWIPTLEGKGLVLVPLSSVVEFDPSPKLAEVQSD